MKRPKILNVREHVAQAGKLSSRAILIETVIGRKLPSELAERPLSALVRMTSAELISGGLTVRQAGLLVASCMLADAIIAERASTRQTIHMSEDVASLASPLRDFPHEEMWSICLDGRNGVIAFVRLAKGGLHGCSVAIKDILRTVLKEGATAFILVHNHPSGDPTPSPEDVAMTRGVAEAADKIGLPLVDHVIVSRNRHASFLDLGLMPEST